MIEESTSHLQAIVWFALIVCRRPQLFGCLVLIEMLNIKIRGAESRTWARGQLRSDGILVL